MSRAVSVSVRTCDEEADARVAPRRRRARAGRRGEQPAHDGSPFERRSACSAVRKKALVDERVVIVREPVVASGDGTTRARQASPLPARAADRRAEELGGADLRATLLALDGKGRRDRRGALGAAVPERPPARRASLRQIRLVLEEVALRVPAPEAERDPIAERLAALFLDPVPLRAGHASIVGPRGRQPAFATFGKSWPRSRRRP
jgi:hypothetical protein